jgi:hypothetical protein
MTRARDLAKGTFSGDLTVDTNTLVVDSANNSVGIGTSSPSGTLHVDGGASNVNLYLSNDSYSSYYYQNAGGSSGVSSPASQAYVWDAGGTERMRIDSSGNVRINNTDAGNYRLRIAYDGGDEEGIGLQSTYSGAGNMLRFLNSAGTTVGLVSTSNTATTYSTSSDYRLKQDWQLMSGASERVLALKPVNFAWKLDGSRVDGFLAHEAQAVVPECVTGTKDAMRDEEYEVTAAVLDADGMVVTEAVMGTRSVPDMQGIDQSKLVPLLTAALQEALTKIASMETRLAALEAN